MNPLPLTYRELYWMACGKQELGWDLSNNIMAAVIDGCRMIRDQVSASAGGKPRRWAPTDYTKMNSYRQ